MKDIIFTKWVLFPSILLCVFVGSLVFFVNLKEDILAKRKVDKNEKPNITEVAKKDPTTAVQKKQPIKLAGDYNGFSIVDEGKALGSSTSQKNDIEISDPQVKEADKDITYIYNVNFSDSVLNKIKNGYQYKVDVKNCSDYRIYKTASSFNGVRKTDISKSFNIQASIFKDFVESSKDFEDSNITIFDLANQKLFEGKIKVPKCYELEEVNSAGKFSIPKPVVNGELEEKTQFIYTFNMDDNSLSELDESGYKYKIFTSCSNRINADEKGFERKVAEGHAYGYSFDVVIDDKYLPDNEDKKLALALYEIKSNDDELLYRGLTYAPNCN